MSLRVADMTYQYRLLYHDLLHSRDPLYRPVIMLLDPDSEVALWLGQSYDLIREWATGTEDPSTAAAAILPLQNLSNILRNFPWPDYRDGIKFESTLSRILGDGETWEVSFQPSGITLRRVRPRMNGSRVNLGTEYNLLWDDEVVAILCTVEFSLDCFLEDYPGMREHFDFSQDSSLPRASDVGLREYFKWRDAFNPYSSEEQAIIRENMGRLCDNPLDAGSGDAEQHP